MPKVKMRGASFLPLLGALDDGIMMLVPLLVMSLLMGTVPLLLVMSLLLIGCCVPLTLVPLLVGCRI